MRTLLGNHHLERRAGSELFTAELATSIQALGHDVAVFTFFKGEFSRSIEQQGIPVFDASDPNAIVGFNPDIVQTNHLSCAHFLRALTPGAIRVHAILGVIPHLEAPPLDGMAYSLGLAVSEEVVARISRTPFGRDAPIAILRNCFDERALAPSRPRETHGVLRVAVISNHISADLVDSLSQLEALGRVKVEYFGIERNPVLVDGALLVRFDLVISIGRTPLLAAACGVPCLMADIHGSDGLLTADNLDLVRSVNFSGRYYKNPIDVTHLEAEMSKVFAFDRELLRSRVVGEYALKSRVEWLLQSYEALLGARRERARAGDCESADALPGEGFVYAELAGAILDLRERLAIVERAPTASPATTARVRPLRLDRLSNTRVVHDPYPHVVVENALDQLDLLNADFPSRDNSVRQSAWTEI